MNNTIVHHLEYNGELPRRLNNPFCYEPSPVCLKAVKELKNWLYGKTSPFSQHHISSDFKAEIDKGKMFGVLVCSYPKTSDGIEELSICSPSERDRESLHLIYLAAYSGQICGQSDWEGFVPAIFDYLQPDGYFKRHEAEITKINHQLNEIATTNADNQQTDAANDPRPQCDKSRHEGETDEEYIKRRQFENAELHRWKLRERARKSAIEAVHRQKQEEITRLKTIRRQKSDALQRWLFSHFILKNGKGEKRSLATASLSLPPAGTGECCEPKLLQYAFQHGLTPVSMAMFWWGESPKNEVRHHLQFYPACNSKCKLILGWMLQGVDVEPNPLESKEHDAKLAAQLKVIYEDDDICVINKPAGLMSVPGSNGRISVQAIMHKRYPDTDSPLIVHRLDMDTSGLMVIAKTMTAYHNLQNQFANHEIRKRYTAVLSEPHIPSPSGRARERHHLSLPLRPDLNDRPRQVVDFENGKEAITEYQFVSDNRVWLWPLTGRTHQLRVHCAHKLGLNNPIKGDRLYGKMADRLYLHAEEITFRHPTKGLTMTFTAKAPF